MVSRLILCAAAAAILLLGAGCGFGPIEDRLYVSEWKSGRDHPKTLRKDWAYEGEEFERFVWADEK